MKNIKLHLPARRWFKTKSSTANNSDSGSDDTYVGQGEIEKGLKPSISPTSPLLPPIIDISRASTNIDTPKNASDSSTLDESTNSREDFDVGPENACGRVGSGSSADVWSHIHIPGIVMKVYVEDDMPTSQLRERTAFTILSTAAHHPNVVRSVDLTNQEYIVLERAEGAIDELFAVYRYMDGTEVGKSDDEESKDDGKKKKSKCIKEMAIKINKLPGLRTLKLVREKRREKRKHRKWTVQLLSGLSHCHSLGIYHGDIKPENILYSSSSTLNLILCDFGTANFFPPSPYFRSSIPNILPTFISTPWNQYCPPEQRHSCEEDPNPCTIAAARRRDLYAIGGIIYYLCTQGKGAHISLDKGKRAIADREVVMRCVKEEVKDELVADVIEKCWFEKDIGAGNLLMMIEEKGKNEKMKEVTRKVKKSVGRGCVWKCK